MKKILLGIAAVFALSTFTPAFADDAKPAGDAEKKPAKKGKKGKKAEEKPAEAAPAK